MCRVSESHRWPIQICPQSPVGVYRLSFVNFGTFLTSKTTIKFTAALSKRWTNVVKFVSPDYIGPNAWGPKIKCPPPLPQNGVISNGFVYCEVSTCTWHCMHCSERQGYIYNVRLNSENALLKITYWDHNNSKQITLYWNSWPPRSTIRLGIYILIVKIFHFFKILPLLTWNRTTEYIMIINKEVSLQIDTRDSGPGLCG